MNIYEFVQMGQNLLSLSGCGNTPASSSRDKSRSGFEIPEETALGLGFEGFHLCFDVTTSVVLVILWPLIDVAVPGAGAHVRATRKCAVVARSQCRSLVGERPLSR